MRPPLLFILALIPCLCHPLRHPSRRAFLGKILPLCGVAAAPLPPARARDLVDFDGFYGLVDGLFQDCRNPVACVASQDDRPPCFLEPFAYDDAFDVAKRKLIGSLRRVVAGVDIVLDDDRYLRATRRVDRGVTDVMEFYFTPNDDTVQFRAEREGAPTDWGANRRALEKVRIGCGFDFVPVMRNRVRVLGAIESPLDRFGPDTNELKRALPPGMDPGDLLPNGVRGELDPRAPVFLTPNRAVQGILGEGRARLPLEQ